MGEVDRASKNSPIQGSGADCTKEALILIRRKIINEKLPVKLVMTVHDQVDTICEESYAPIWKEELTRLMEKAAKRVVTSGLLKAETEVSVVWKK